MDIKDVKKAITKKTPVILRCGEAYTILSVTLRLTLDMKEWMYELELQSRYDGISICKANINEVEIFEME
jgi:hypothetical protein